MNEKLSLFLKGILMGSCDLVPGISGGTIAFITGIYERLIKAISQITPKNKIDFFMGIIKNDKKLRKKVITKMDLGFLGILFSGVFISILLGSHLISYLLENQATYLLSFFVGLILVSSKMIYKEINTHSIQNIALALVGFAFGLSLLFVSPKMVLNPSWIYILLGGFLAVSALFLPGISGSFVLLIMGLYEYIINSVKDLFFGWKTLLIFGVGALGGVIFISRAITYLFEKDRCKTLYILLGIVLGSLVIPTVRVVQSVTEPSIFVFVGILVCFGLGSFFGHYIEKIGINMKTK